MSEDVSDLPRGELEALATRLQALIQSAADSIVTIDRFGIIEAVNPATCRMFGYSEEELIGRNVSMLMPASHAAKHDEYLEQYLATGEAHIIGVGREVEGRRRDGSQFPLHLSVSEATFGDRTVFTGILRDLTDWRRSEHQAAWLGRILEESLNEIYAFGDDSLQFRRVNRGACENLGYSEEELYEMTPLDIKPEFDETRFRALLRPLLTGIKRKIEFETTHRRKDGTDYRVEVHLQHHRDEGEFVAIVLDLSDRDILQRQLIQAQRMEAVGRLAGGIAHDFNNLLTTIRGSTELVRGRLDAEDRSQRALGRVSMAAERGSSLTQQLLAFGGRQISRPEALDVNSVAHQMIEMTRQLITDDIEVVLDLEKQPLKVRADATLLDQVVMNFFVNANDAMPEGGRLRVRTRYVDVDDIRATSLEMAPGPAACFTVEDSGSGMSQEVLAQIFEPFFTTKEVGKGTGLGLSTVHGIAKQCGWGLEVRSEVGAGSSFSVLIPIADTEIEAQEDFETPRSPERTAEILLVEDDEMVRDLAEEVLVEAGHTVYVARNPAEAMEVAAARISQFDLLLSDVIMPGMTGIELARRLRGVAPDLRVILMSGYPDAALASRGVAESEFTLLRKPFSNEELAQRLDEVLDQAGSEKPRQA